MEKKYLYEPVPESLRKSMELTEKLRESASPIIEQQDRIQRIVDAATIPKIAISSPAMDALKEITDNSAVRALQENSAAMNVLTENSRAMQAMTEVGSAFESLHNSGFLHTMGELAIKSAIPSYQFESPALKAIEAWSNTAVANLATGLTALVTNPVMQEIQSISSNFGKWLQTVDFSPLTSILENIQNIGFDYDYEEVNEVFLKAMFDARWFPYAGWIADFRIVDAMLEILDTSRASKNRVKRIDKLIFSYYDKEEINNLKRGWRQMNLPSYMTRILVQSVQAYHRREYALTVSALSTLWEGIIQEKMNDTSY